MTATLEVTTVTPPAPVAKRVSTLVLLGAGSVGREFLGQLVAHGGACAAQVRVSAVIDRSGYVLAPEGLSPDEITSLCEHKRGGRPLATCARGLPASPFDALAFIAARSRGQPILI